MILVEFPLTGFFADLSAASEILIVFIMFQTFFNFLIKFIKAPKEDKRTSIRNLAWGALLFTLGITYIIFILGDFVITGNEREMFNIYGYYSITTGAIIFFFITETSDKSKIRPFSLISLGILITISISIIFNLPNIWITIISMCIALPIIIIYEIIYFDTLIKMSNADKKTMIQIRYFIASILLSVIGYICMGDFIINIFGIPIRLFGDVLMISGLILFQYSLNRLPDFNEFDWIDNLKTVFIISKSGMALFSRFYESHKSSTSPENQKHIISGSLMSIKTVLKEMTGNEEVNQLVVPNKTLLFQQRENFIAVLIANKSLTSLKIRLRNLTDEFDYLYNEELNNWNGNLAPFLPVEAIVDRIFIPLKKE